MVSQATTAAGSELNPFFTTPPSPPPPLQSQQPSGFWRGIQSVVFSPGRMFTEEAVQGLANRFTEVFNANQLEITNRVRDLFVQALSRRAPEKYTQLLHSIRLFLQHPSRQDLEQIKALLSQLHASEIQTIAPAINSMGLNSLITLRQLLDTEIDEQAPALNSTTESRLKEAELILNAMIENYEGALIHALGTLTQSMMDPNAPLQTLCRQLNDPQHGIFARLATLRHHLLSQADPALRESKTALEAYRLGLEHCVDAIELKRLLQNVYTTLSSVIQRRESIPQISLEHWGTLELFHLGVQVLLDQSPVFPPNPELLHQTDELLMILTQGFHAQRGMIEEAADILVEGVGRAVAHLENLPRRMMQNIFSPQHSLPLPSLSVSSTQPSPSLLTPAPSFLNLNTLATQGRQLLDLILTSTVNAASQHAARGLSTLIHLCFVKIQEHIQASQENVHLLNTIHLLIEQLQRACERNSWTELTNALQGAFRFIQSQQVYLQGLRLPLNPVRTHFSAIPDFLQNITNHQNALQSPEQRAPERISLDVIQKQQILLKSRLAVFGPLKLIAEKICGFQTDETFYATLLRNETAQMDLTSIFQDRFFEKIDHSDSNLLRRWIAKGIYHILTPLCKYYTDSFLDKFFTFLSQWIENSPTVQQSREEWIIKLMRNWLAVTSGAYNSVASTPVSQTKDFHFMLEEAMKIPERNGGLTQHELFAAVAKTALDIFGPKIKWKERIDDYFSAEIPPFSPLYFFNPIVGILNAICSFGFKALVIVPQWVGNQLIQEGAKIILSHTPFLKELTEQTMESLRRNTPASYAMQRMIYRQLQKILSLLQHSLNNEDPERADTLLNRNTPVKKVEIAGLVEYLLEVLNKSQYRTQDRLYHFLHNRAPIRDRIERELEDTALPEIMETAVTTISIAIHALSGEEELREMFYDGLSLANHFFDLHQPIPEEEIASVEKGIRELSDQILETAIFHAIGEKFDFTNEKQKKGIANFIRTLKEQTYIFTSQIEQKSAEIRQNRFLSPDHLVKEISKMIELSSQYHHARVEALGKVDGNRIFHTETKYHLNELSKNLLEYCNPVAKELNDIKNLADEKVRCEKNLKHLLTSQTIALSLNDKLQQNNLSIEDLIFCKNKIFSLRFHMTRLRQNPFSFFLIDEIERWIQEFSLNLKMLEDLKKSEKSLRQIYPVFEQLKQEKQLYLGSSSSLLKLLERKLLQLTAVLPIHEQEEQLNQKILNLMLAQTSEALEVAALQFSTTYFQINARNLTHSHEHLAKLQRNKDNLQAVLSQEIQNFSSYFTQNHNTIHHHLETLSRKTAELEQWSQRQNELPIWNLFVFDMQWITETVKSLAFDRARARIQQLFESLYQRHHYIGFLNQVAFLPFLEKFGPHHVKIYRK